MKKAVFKLASQFLHIRVIVNMVEDKKIVIVEEWMDGDSEPAPSVLSTINLSLKNLGVSVSMNHSRIQKPYEAIFISFHEIQFIKESTELDDTYQARIRFFQIDQNHPHLMAYPVILSPQRFKQYIEKDKDKEDKYIFNSLMRVDTKVKNSTIIKSIAIDMNNINIKVSEIFIRLLLEIFSEIQYVMSNKEEFLIVRRKDDWKQFDVKVDNKPVFIQ